MRVTHSQRAKPHGKGSRELSVFGTLTFARRARASVCESLCYKNFGSYKFWLLSGRWLPRFSYPKQSNCHLDGYLNPYDDLGRGGLSRRCTPGNFIKNLDSKLWNPNSKSHRSSVFKHCFSIRNLEFKPIMVWKNSWKFQEENIESDRCLLAGCLADQLKKEFDPRKWPHFGGYENWNEKIQEALTIRLRRSSKRSFRIARFRVYDCWKNWRESF